MWCSILCDLWVWDMEIMMYMLGIYPNDGYPDIIFDPLFLISIELATAIVFLCFISFNLGWNFKKRKDVTLLKQLELLMDQDDWEEEDDEHYVQILERIKEVVKGKETHRDREEKIAYESIKHYLGDDNV